MMENAKSFLIPANLTGDQVDAFCREWNLHAPDVRRFAATLCRVVGTPAEASGKLRVFDVADASYGPLDAKYVRHADAEALIAARDAEIADKDREIEDLKAAAETVISFDEAYRRKIERRVLPAAMGDMMKIASLIEWAQKIRDQFGNTCVYAVDLSWGAVALNREADDRKRLSPGKTSWTDNPDFEGADTEAAFASLKEENTTLTAQIDTIAQETREACALVVERWGLHTLQATGMWLIDKAGVAAAIRHSGGEKA
ncbi:hypothetical protein AA13594_2277 [Gluconacetobacter azotocaptans DSM 13594]|nr:hypothetical protein AA13594_2277 [Gluconacetobacter azotocaptans DSM 13594]